MTNWITAAEMQALETAAIESGSVTGLELMERAGSGVLQAIERLWPNMMATPGLAIVLCGPGNNGGDGFVIARLLQQRGWTVHAYLYGYAEKLPPDARSNYDSWAGLAGKTQNLSFPVTTSREADQIRDLVSGSGGPVLLIDALFGTGLTRSLTGLRSILTLCNTLHCEHPLYRISVDIPSGLSEEGPLGDSENCVFRADLTVSFHCLKAALRSAQAISGRTLVADIGL